MPTLAEVAQAIDGRLDGDGTLEITHCCEIAAGSPGGITFLANVTAEDLLPETGATAVILNQEVGSAGKPAIRVDNPTRGFALALALLHSPAEPPREVHPAASVGAEVALGRNISIGPFATIGNGVVIGDDSIIGAGAVVGDGSILGRGVRLFPNVVLYDGMEIGNDVRIHSGTVIGSDGFGYVTEDDQHLKVPQVGKVVIGDRVEMGANCAIDRGTIGATVIGADTKLDNLVHIAHNVKIGRGCLIAGEVGIAGSTVIGDYVTLAGQVGVISHISIGDRTVVASRGAVMQPVEAGKFIGGYPAEDQRRWLRKQAAIKGLPDLGRRVRALEKKLDMENSPPGAGE